jgi:hypothetical protein
LRAISSVGSRRRTRRGSAEASGQRREATAKEIGRLSLAEALVTIDEAAMVAACLAALAGDRSRDAALTLRAVGERATRRRRERGVA